MAGEDKLSPSGLEKLTYKQQGWNYILDRNMDVINHCVSKVGYLLDVNVTGIRHSAVLGWNASSSKWQPMYATTTTTTTTTEP